MVISEKISSQFNLIPEFLSGLLEKIKGLAISEDDIFKIKLSLGEALINAAKHGNKLNPDLFVEVNIEAKRDHLIIKVKDAGEGFDFKNIADPTTPENLEKNFGRGIFLIRNLMDNMDFFDCGRGIKMIKFFKKGAENENKRRKTR